jgi:hypothetical protein
MSSSCCRSKCKLLGYDMRDQRREQNRCNHSLTVSRAQN